MTFCSKGLTYWLTHCYIHPSPGLQFHVLSTVQCPGTLQSHLTWYIVAILQNPSTDKTYNSTPYIHIKGNDSIAYLIFYFKIIFWKRAAPCHKALNIAISSVWRDKYLCPFLVVGSPSVICLSLYMTGYTWDYEKLKIKLKLKKKSFHIQQIRNTVCVTSWLFGIYCQQCYTFKMSRLLQYYMQ